jgi:hypothetical protein
MHVHRYKREGFVVLPQQIGRETLASLSTACDHVLTQTRAASGSTGHSSTHITGLLAPEYYEGRPELLERLACFVSSPLVVALVRDLCRAVEGAPDLRSLEYFHEPSQRDYDGAWHRDGDPVGLDHLNAHLNRPTLLRFRIAFAADSHLEYVPGSHLRSDTRDELRTRRGPVRNGELASDDAVRIELQPGDVCLFDTWGIHRGRYRQGTQRRTLDLLFGFGARRAVQLEQLRNYALTLRKAL